MSKQHTFDDFVKEYIGSVTLFARATCSNRSIIDDVVQETFIRAWKYFPTLKAESSAKSWLMRICRNVINDVAPKWQRNSIAEVDYRADLNDAYSQSDLMQLMDELTLEHRQVLVLCGLLGYDYEIVAEVLDIPIGTVRSRLARARSAMQELVSQSESEMQIGIA